MDINLESLGHAILEVLDDESTQYDIDVILKSATLVWDNTAVQVKSKDFEMIFDVISYELMDYQGHDMDETEEDSDEEEDDEDINDDYEEYNEGDDE